MTVDEQIPSYPDVEQMLWQDRATEAQYWAERFLKEQPDVPQVQALAARVRQWTEHLCDPEKYRAFYDGHRSVYVPAASMPILHQQIERLSVVRRWVMEQSAQSVLDLGCFDGCALLNLLAITGGVGVGVDVDTKALAHAAAAARDLTLRATFVDSRIEDLDLGQQFDAVLLMEILEHVPDVRAALRVAERHLAPRGRIYITVPNGSVPHAGNEHEAREHVRVFTEQTLLAALGDRVLDGNLVLTSTPHGERVVCYRRPVTAFVCNPVAGGWNPDDSVSYGGSEEMVVNLARTLADAGHLVEVFHNPNAAADAKGSTTGGPGPVASGGALTYRRHAEWNPLTPRDLLVVVKHPALLEQTLSARSVLFWSADPNRAEEFPAHRLEKLDRIVAISQWHAKELRDNGLPEAKIAPIPLALSPELLAATACLQPQRDPHACVYASSFDRGLERLLDLWPTVRKQVPDATLHVWYGWGLFDRVAGGSPEALAWKAKLAGMLAQPGVIQHERTTVDDPAIYAHAGLWTYPCKGGERFCLTAIKAQRLGAIPVVTPVMALHETVKHGLKCEPTEYVQALLFALTHPDWQEKVRGPMMADPQVGQTWDVVYRAHWAPLWREKFQNGTLRPPRIPALKQQTLTACLITYNAENQLLRTIKSVLPVVDEIHVADQNSTDATRELLARFPQVRVFDARPPHYCLVCERQMPSQHFIETDHEPYGFHGPRNDSIAHVTTDWILWIDSDEELVRGHNLLKYLRPNAFKGYAIRQWHFSIQPPNAFKPDLPVRMFRNGEGIRFFGKIHEHPETKINEGVSPACVLSDVDIAHDGYFVEEGRRRKFERNIGLMHADRKFFGERLLGKFLWLRDLLHLTRYELEATGGRITPMVHQRCQEAIALYEEAFLPHNNLYAMEGLDYYSEALRILNIGFDAQYAVSAAPHEAQPSPPKRARFSSVERFKQALAAQAESAVAPFTGKYV